MQRGPQNIVERNPRDLFWLHQTISDSFAQGAPDPKNKEKKLPGEKVDKIASQLASGKIDYKAFPPLQTFTLEGTAYGAQPGAGTFVTYSLSNRRLTAFKASKVEKVLTKPAKFKEVLKSLWKMTSASGGEFPPHQTLTQQEKDCYPPTYTTLGLFRVTMEKEMERAGAAWDANPVRDPQDPRKIIPKEKYVKNEAKAVAIRDFGFTKRPGM